MKDNLNTPSSFKKKLSLLHQNSSLKNINTELLCHLSRDGAANLIFKVVYTIANFLLSVVLTRFLGAENYGQYSYAYAIIMILVVPTHFGLPILLVREISSFLESNAWSSIRGILQWALRFSGILSVIIISGFFILIFAVPDALDSSTKEILLVGIFYLPFFAMTTNLGGILRGFRKVALGQLPEQILIPVSFLFLIILVKVFGQYPLTPQRTMGLNLISIIISFIISCFLLVKILPKEIKQVSPTIQGKQWSTSMFSLAMITSMRLINKWASLLILGLFVPDTELAYFRIAVQMSVLADFGIQLLNPVTSPQLARLYAKRDMHQIQHLSVLIARISFAINLVVTVAFLVFGQLFIRYFYGNEYLVSYVPLLILLVAQMINSSVGSVANLLNMTGFEKDTAFARVVTTVLNIALSFMLCPRFGIMGAAIAASVSIIVWNIMLYFLVKDRLNIRSFIFAKSNIKEETISS